MAMAAITTHDLPTAAGLWSGSDMGARRAIGLAADEKGYRKIRKRLVDATGLSGDDSASEAIRRAYEALARAPSAVLVANLDDALAVSERPNMPGTVDEWPNWSLALPAPLEEIETAALPRAIAKSLSRQA
jgi:4-alpha-glucanotransferase